MADDIIIKNKTIGAMSRETQMKAPDTHDPIEIERELHKDYEKEFFECLKRGREAFPDTDFYVTVITKKERLMENVLRNYFFPRVSCPTPDYDQTVYHYDKKLDKIELLWVIPSKDTCMMMKEHALEVVDDERELRNYVLDFADGTLMRKSLMLNGEIATAVS